MSPVWSAMRTEVLGGQFLDISNEARGDETVEAAMRVNRYKTAAYTIERPLHLGAALFGADAELIDAYRTFGTDIGIAFQLRDDLLGVFGDPSVTGKPSGDDLIAGKRTVLFAMALARADAADPAAAELLRNGIGTQLTDTEVDTLRQVITDLGAVTDVENADRHPRRGSCERPRLEHGNGRVQGSPDRHGDSGHEAKLLTVTHVHRTRTVSSPTDRVVIVGAGTCRTVCGVVSAWRRPRRHDSREQQLGRWASRCLPGQ